MKAVAVMAGAHQRARPARDVITGDEGEEDFVLCRAGLLREREQTGQHRDCRMPKDRHVDVVEIERVRRRAVD